MQSLSILFFPTTEIPIIEPLKEPFLTHRFLLFQKCNANELIFFFNDTKLSCYIDVTQRGVSFPKTGGVQFPAEPPSFAV